MSLRTAGNPPFFSTNAATFADPSTTSLIGELILPTYGNGPSNYEVRFGVGGSTGMLWTLECCLSSAVHSTAIRPTEHGAAQRATCYTGSNQTSEYVMTMRAYPGDRFRARVLVTPSTGNSAAGWIQAEAIP